MRRFLNINVFQKNPMRTKKGKKKNPQMRDNNSEQLRTQVFALKSYPL